MSKIINIIFCLLFLLGTTYLILPAPKDFPDLPRSIKSIEPGDTVQVKGVSAYYTDMSRKDAVNFYFRYFSRSTFLNIPLITYKLNHPPERIREVLRDTQQSTYVEELVHPLRESVFVNGFEWNNDPFTPPKQRVKNILIVQGQTYQFKVTLFYQESKIWQRLVIYYLSLGVCYLLVKEFVRFIKKLKKNNELKD